MLYLLDLALPLATFVETQKQARFVFEIQTRHKFSIGNHVHLN